MRISLKKRIFAVLLCCCIVFTSGCFPIHSILGSESYDLTQDGSLKLDYTMTNRTQAVSGEYPDGQRAFKFKGCTYEADISDFKLIDVAGDVCLYYYTGIKVIGESGENKKGYYDKANAKLKYFWTIAGYNFNTENYFEVYSQEYYPASGDAGKMSGNPVIRYTNTYYRDYVINVGYFFIKFSVNCYTDKPKEFMFDKKEIWKLSNDNKKEIREKLGIKGDNNNFCCTDLAVKNRDEEKYAATFMILPTDDSFNQKNVMFEVQLKSEVKDNKTVTEIELKKKENNVKTVEGGNILSSNPTSGNCIYVITANSKDREKIKFGIDNRDRRTRFEIEIGKTTNENNVLQSFSVKDYTAKNSDGNEYVSTEESRLELVFKNRIEYYKIERYSNGFTTEYRAIYLKTYWLNQFCSTYLSSDDIPSILDLPWGVNISSTTDGFRCIKESGKTHWSSLSGAAYCSFRYGGLTLVIGFDGFEFDKTVQYFDENGKETGVSKSKSEFTLAQLPFATVRIV